MKIKVEQKHIDSGRKRSCVGCPIALAINDQLNPYPTAWVRDNNKKKMAYIDFGVYHFVPSHRAYEFIKAFDDDKPVEPFTLVLRVKGREIMR